MRAFVAVPVPRPEDSKTGTPAFTLDHLTLRFLGEVDARSAKELVRSLAPAVAPLTPFEFVLEGVGAFPSPERPRVLWRGVTRGAEELQALARVVHDTVERAGVAPDPAPFVPHATLFRVRSARDRERARRLLAPNAPLPAPRVVAVTEVEFVESELTPAGARHRVLARFPLSGSGR